jgi:predicted thioesterase
MSEDPLIPGLWAEASFAVTPERSAPHVGSGDVAVLATPAMVAFVEETCRMLVQPCLRPGETTVGTQITLRHLAPTPVGQEVRVRVEVSRVEGRRILFGAQVWDEVEPVGEATHERAVVKVGRFLERVGQKKWPVDGGQ